MLYIYELGVSPSSGVTISHKMVGVLWMLLPGLLPAYHLNTFGGVKPPSGPVKLPGNP